MKLGTARTGKFAIGAFDLRVGALEKAMRLGPMHSVGAVEDVEITTELQTTDKMAGFPQRVVDTAIVSTSTRITATLSETSLRNLRLLMGNGVWSYDGINTDIQARVVTRFNIAEGARALTIKPTTAEGWINPPFAIGDILNVYDKNDESRFCTVRVQNVIRYAKVAAGTPKITIGLYANVGALPATGTNGQVALVGTGVLGATTLYTHNGTAWTSTGAATVIWWGLILDTDTPLVLGQPLATQTVTINGTSTTQNVTALAGTQLFIYRARTAAGGSLDVANYFSATLTRLDRASKRPVNFHFWKCTLASGMTWRANATDWATFSLELSVLEPNTTEYFPGGPLAHLADIIPKNPSYMLVDVSDDARVVPTYNLVDIDEDVEPLKAATNDTGLDYQPGTLASDPNGATDTN